jgi:hypothetical protein
MADRTHRIVWGTTALAGVVCCFSFFQFALPYHLFFKEELQLFLLTEEYFLSYWDKPAWLACYAGDFLTQFFYLRGGGATTLSLVLLVEYGLVVQVLWRFGCGRSAAFFALLPVGVDGFLHCGLYYGLAASVSLILVLLVFWAFTWIKRPVVAFPLGLLLLPCLYSMAGASFFLFPVLAGIYGWRKGSGRWLYGLVLLVVAGLYPAGVRSHYLLTAGQAYRYPFPSSLNIRGVDSGREQILALAVEAGRGNWETVGRRAKRAAGLANPIVTYYANIASSEQGRLPEDLLSSYQPFTGGLFLPVNPQSDWLTIFFSHEVFFHLGDMNMAQHSAMLGMIFSPRHRSSRMLRRLAEINQISGDTATARKYVRMLDATLFHRSRVKRRGGPEPGSFFARDTLRTASDYVASLELLTESHPDGNRALDYLLCYHLLNKDIPAFAAAYDRYRKGRAGGYVPRLYSEALLIRLAAEKAPIEELRSYGIPNEVIAAFMEYTRLYEQSAGAPERLRERFGSGYWFYYHFANVKEEKEE